MYCYFNCVLLQCGDSGVGVILFCIYCAIIHFKLKYWSSDVTVVSFSTQKVILLCYVMHHK